MTGAPTTQESPSGNASAARRWDAALMHNYGTPGIELVSGRGAVLTDADGREYLDLLGGIAVNALGHAHPAVVRAVTEQIATLAHVSNYFSHPTVLALAERLLEISGAGGAGKVLFTNSGTESNEAAFKIARLTGRPGIVATDKAFHGRTMGALAMTGQPSKRQPFEPMPPGVSFVPYGDTAALASAVDASTAAVMLEPIQGEAGVIVPPDGYLADARRIASDAGALLMLDEVQTGIGRTGEWFAHQHTGIRPDVMTLAKGLGGGLPMGAVIAYDDAADLLTPGLHGSTFAGNPVCAAAALAVLDTIAADRLLDHTATLGKHLSTAIEDLHHPLIAEVRGQGLLIGVQLTEPIAAAANARAAAAGYLTNAAAPDVLRLAPPLILTTDQADGFVAALPAILDAAAPA